MSSFRSRIPVGRSPLFSRPHHPLDNGEVHPRRLIRRLTNPEATDWGTRGIAASSECPAYLLDSTPVRAALKGDGHGFSEGKRQGLGLGLHRACARCIASEGCEDEQDGCNASLEQALKGGSAGRRQQREDQVLRIDVV